MSWLQQGLQSIKKSLRAAIDATMGMSRRDVVYGLRMTAITVCPLLAALLLKQSALGLIGFIGALYTAIADPGGTYRTRARSMALGLSMIVLSCFCATLLGRQTLLAVMLIFVWIFIAGMLHVFGSAGSKLGFAMIGSFIILLSQPADLATASLRSAVILLGGLWAMLLTLWAWPIRPYQPIRDAVAGYYQALRALLACTYSSHKRYDTGGLQWEETLWQQRINVQTVRDTAHQMVSQSRDPQSGASLTAQHMFLLMLKADMLFATLTALSESIKAAPLQVHQATVQEALDRVVDVVDDGLARVAEAVQHSEMVGEHIDLESVLEELDDSQAALHKMPLERETDYVAFANARHIFRTLRQIILSLQSIISIVDEVDFEPRSGPAMQPPGTRDQRSVPGNAWHKFVDNLTPHSQVYRHALRLSVTVALATAISTFFKIPHGYWMPLTAAFILRPDFQATRQRVWQRVGGTIAGGACAIVLVALIYNQMILYFLIAVLCFLTYAHFSRHYGVFSLFLTPFLVLFIDVAHPGNWEVALERVANTVAGGVLALIAIYLFWPQWESERLPEQIARALAANRCFFHCVLAGYLGEQSSPAEIEKARQQANLECVNAASSLQRLANEPRARQVRFEQFYALVMYTQRLCSTITALSAQPVPSIALRALPGLSSLARQVEDTLQRVEDAVSSGKQPLRMPQLEEGLRTVQNALSTWIAARIGELAAQDIKTPNRELLRAYAPLRIHLHDLVQDAQSLYQAISTS